ncbi:MAG: hypothetical protein IIA87_00985 [Nanoarchaeota archaeon]|nr:hypothetical protein [Nanoarchaeota archaeon]
MKCNCKWCTSIMAIVILVFLFWQTVASTWIIAIAAILLLVHAWVCKNCGICSPEMAAKPAGKKKR